MPDLQIDYGDPGRSYPQVDSPPVFSPQSGNCSGNEDNVPTQSQDEYVDTQTDIWVLAENISNCDYDDHSQPSLGDENTHCSDSGYHSGPASLKGHSDLDSSENHDQDSWLTLDNSWCQPSVSQENHTTEAGPPETMAKVQFHASQPTESQVVMAKELARLQQELQSVQNTLADECDHFTLVSKDYEWAIQLLLASSNRLCYSITQLQAVIRPTCSSAQSSSDSSLAPAKDVNGSDINLHPFPSPSGDGIPKCQDTPNPDGVPGRLVLLRPEPKPQLFLQKDGLLQLDVPRPDYEPKLSLKRISEAHTSLDAFIHQDSPVHSTASGDVHFGSKCTSIHHDLEISVSDEDET